MFDLRTFEPFSDDMKNELISFVTDDGFTVRGELYVSADETWFAFHSATHGETSFATLDAMNAFEDGFAYDDETLLEYALTEGNIDRDALNKAARIARNELPR